MTAPEPLLDIAGLVVRFGPVRAVDGVSLQLAPGPYGLALVGESGSGKTTIGRAALRLVNAVGGTIRFEGKIVTGPWPAGVRGSSPGRVQPRGHGPASALITGTAASRSAV